MFQKLWPIPHLRFLPALCSTVARPLVRWLIPKTHCPMSSFTENIRKCVAKPHNYWLLCVYSMQIILGIEGRWSDWWHWSCYGQGHTPPERLSSRKSQKIQMLLCSESSSCHGCCCPWDEGSIIAWESLERSPYFTVQYIENHSVDVKLWRLHSLEITHSVEGSAARGS